MSDNRIYRTHQSEIEGPTNKLARLKESIEKRRRFIRDADDFVRCLAIELEIELGFRLAIIPVGKVIEFAPPQWLSLATIRPDGNKPCFRELGGRFVGDSRPGRRC